MVVMSLLMSGVCLAQGDKGTKDCQKVENLTEELKRAYAQLKEVVKEIEGMEVGIRCLHKDKGGQNGH